MADGTMSAIGLYLVRVGPSGRSVSLAHLVESEVADRVVCRCGRQMHRRTRDGALRTASGSDRTCFWCAARHDAAADRVADVPEPVASEQEDWSPV